MSTRTSKTTIPTASTTTTPASHAQPPPPAKVPLPPETYDPSATADYRTAQPRKAELASIGDAVKELAQFVDYAQVLGRTAPPAAHVSQVLAIAAQWSTLLVATTLWFNYVRSGAAAAWKDARGLVEALKAPFALASTLDPALASTYPALTRLLGVSKAIAEKSASTKKLNAKAIAEGKPPIHGKIGRRRKKVASPPATPVTSAPSPAPVTPEPVAPAAAPPASPEVPRP